MSARSILIVFLLTAAACSFPLTAATEEAIPTFTPRPTPRPTSTTPPPEHRIGIRVVEGVGEFYNRITGAGFVPRGNNYIRLAEQDEGGRTIVYHSTFNTDFYDQDLAAASLQAMHAQGYNVARVFLNHCCDGGIGGGSRELSPGYMDNVSDFLQLAKQNDIYVIFALDWLPDGKYGDLINRVCCELFNFNNPLYLPADGVLANQLFFQDFILALIERDAPLDYIFAYSLRNELYFDSNYPPFTLTSGIVETGNGQSYDMASEDEKQRMMDEGLVYFIDQVRAAILEVDPTALVTVGFFQPHGPNPTRIGDPRIIETYPAIWLSGADFIDLHAYPGGDLTLAEYVENYRIEDMQLKPIIMGEFGAFRAAYSNASAAARALQRWQIDSCALGFDGWLLWTWDGDEQTELYNGLSANGEINDALAPLNRPDPCSQ